MRISHRQLRTLVESIILEGVEADRDFLKRKFEEYEVEIENLPNSAIKWLSARFGETPTTREASSFYDSLLAIMSFVENESAVRGNAAKLRSTGASSVTDPTRMSAADIRDLVGALKDLRRAKGQTVDTRRAADPESDVIARVGGWKISIPSTRENSCVLGLENPKLCTTRSAGNNLWAHYISDSILFTFTREGLTGDEARDQMFIWTFGEDCQPRYGEEGEYGAETVDGSNNNIQEDDIRARLGGSFDRIKDLLTRKCENLGGKHPAYARVIAATQSVKGLEELTHGIKGKDLDDLLAKVAGMQLSDEVERELMSRSDAVRSALARSRHTSEDTLRKLAQDLSRIVSNDAKQNPNFPAEDRAVLALDSGDPAALLGLAKTSQDPNILRRIIRNKSDDTKNARAFVAAKQDLPDDLIEELVLDPNASVRQELAGNKSIPPDLLISIFDNDKSEEVRRVAVKNPNFPRDYAYEIMGDKSISGFIRMGALDHAKRAGDVEALRKLASDSDSDVALIARTIYTRLMRERQQNESRLRRLIRQML